MLLPKRTQRKVFKDFVSFIQFTKTILHRGEYLGGGLGDLLVILHGAAGHPDAADHAVTGGQREAAGEADEAGVGVLDVVQAAPRLGQRPDHLGVHLEEGGGLGFLDRDVHAPEPSPVHPKHSSLMTYEVFQATSGSERRPESER